MHVRTYPVAGRNLQLQVVEFQDETVVTLYEPNPAQDLRYIRGSWAAPAEDVTLPVPAIQGLYIRFRAGGGNRTASLLDDDKVLGTWNL